MMLVARIVGRVIRLTTTTQVAILRIPARRTHGHISRTNTVKPIIWADTCFARAGVGSRPPTQFQFRTNYSWRDNLPFSKVVDVTR